MNGLRYFNALVTLSKKPMGMVDRIRSRVIRQIVFLVGHWPLLLTDRPVCFTDIVYITEKDLLEYMKLYIKLGLRFDHLAVEQENTLVSVESDPGMVIFSLYMHEFLCLLDNSINGSKYEQNQDSIKIRMGVGSLISFIRSHSESDDWNNFNFQYVAEIMNSSYPALQSKTWGLVDGMFNDVISADVSVVAIILKSITQYYHHFFKCTEDTTDLECTFTIHPIYRTICKDFSVLRPAFEEVR